MPAEQFANTSGFVATVITAAIPKEAGPTTFKVTLPTTLPKSLTEGPFRVIIDKEIMMITKIEGENWKATRGLEETAPEEHTTGTPIFHKLTAGSFKDAVNLAGEKGSATVAHSGVVYVMPYPHGNDANGGGSWSDAKATLRAAYLALPATPDKIQEPIVKAETSETFLREPVRAGVIMMGAASGTEENPVFKIESKIIRKDTVKFVGGKRKEEVFFPERGEHGEWRVKKFTSTPYVECPSGSASAADIGKILVLPVTYKKTEHVEVVDYWTGKLDPTTNLRVNEAPGSPGAKKYYTVNKGCKNKETCEVYVVEPGVKLGAGVELRGTGMAAGTKGRKEKTGGTVIEDIGNGLSIWLYAGAPKYVPVEGRAILSRFTLRTGHRPTHKQTNAGKYESECGVWGIMCSNAFGTQLENINVTGYTAWGAYIGDNAGSEFSCYNCVFTECGNVSSKIGNATGENDGKGKGVVGLMTGGLYSAGDTAVQTFINNNFLNNYGTCIEVSGGHMLGNVINHAAQTKDEGGKKVPKTGAALISAGGANNVTNIWGGWMEGSRVHICSAGGYVTCVGVHFQAIPKEGGVENGEGETEIESYKEAEEYEVGEIVEYPAKSGVYYEAVEAVPVKTVPPANEKEGLEKQEKGETEFWEIVTPAEYAIEGGCNVMNCLFKKHKKASIKETGNDPISWNQCHTLSGTTKEVEFIERTGSGPDVPFSAAWGVGRIGGYETGTNLESGAIGFVSPMYPPITLGWTTATVEGKSCKTFKNIYGYDIRCTIPVTWAESGGIVEYGTKGYGEVAEKGAEFMNWHPPEERKWSGGAEFGGKSSIEVYLASSETLVVYAPAAKAVVGVGKGKYV